MRRSGVVLDAIEQEKNGLTLKEIISLCAKCHPIQPRNYQGKESME